MTMPGTEANVGEGISLDLKSAQCRLESDWGYPPKADGTAERRPETPRVSRIVKMTAVIEVNR